MPKCSIKKRIKYAEFSKRSIRSFLRLKKSILPAYNGWIYSLQCPHPCFQPDLSWFPTMVLMPKVLRMYGLWNSKFNLFIMIMRHAKRAFQPRNDSIPGLGCNINLRFTYNHHLCIFLYANYLCNLYRERKKSPYQLFCLMYYMGHSARDYIYFYHYKDCRSTH